MGFNLTNVLFDNEDEDLNNSDIDSRDLSNTKKHRGLFFTGLVSREKPNYRDHDVQLKISGFPANLPLNIL